jgi:hypothetical protein
MFKSFVNPLLDSCPSREYLSTRLEHRQWSDSPFARHLMDLRRSLLEHLSDLFQIQRWQLLIVIYLFNR